MAHLELTLDGIKLPQTGESHQIEKIREREYGKEEITNQKEHVISEINKQTPHIKKLQAECEKFKRESEEIQREISDDKETLEEIRKEIKDEKDEYNRVLGDRIKNITDYENKKFKLTNAQKKYDSLGDKLTELYIDKECKEEEIHIAKIAREKLLGNGEEHLEESEECPFDIDSMRQKLTGKNEGLRIQSQKIGKLHINITNTKKEIECAENSIIKLEERERRLKKNRLNYDINIEKRILNTKDLEKKISTDLSDIGQLKIQRESIKDFSTTMFHNFRGNSSRQPERDRLTSQITEIERVVTDNKNILKRSNFELDEKKSELDRIDDKIQEIGRTIDSLKYDTKEKRSQLQEFDDKLVKKKEKLCEITKKKLQIDKLITIHKALTSTATLSKEDLDKVIKMGMADLAKKEKNIENLILRIKEANSVRCAAKDKLIKFLEARKELDQKVEKHYTAILDLIADKGSISFKICELEHQKEEKDQKLKSFEHAIQNKERSIDDLRRHYSDLNDNLGLINYKLRDDNATHAKIQEKRIFTITATPGALCSAMSTNADET